MAQVGPQEQGSPVVRGVGRVNMRVGWVGHRVYG